MSAGMDCRRLEPLLSAHLDGELAAGERALVAAHLARCAVCREALAALARLEALVERPAPLLRGHDGIVSPAAEPEPEEITLSLPSPRGGGEPVSPEAWEALWTEVRRRTRQVEERRVFVRGRERQLWAAFSGAAAAVAAAVLLAVWLPTFFGAPANPAATTAAAAAAAPWSEIAAVPEPVVVAYAESEEAEHIAVTTSASYEAMTIRLADDRTPVVVFLPAPIRKAAEATPSTTESAP